MDFYLDNLLSFPDVTVSSCQQQEGLILLTLDFLPEGIYCHHCQTYTDNLHQTRPILVRDLSILGQGVYLKVPRRQFICPNCGQYPTERLEWIKLGKKWTKRYEEYLYERVKELTVEQVAKNENLSPKQVQKIFSRQAELKKKTGGCLKD